MSECTHDCSTCGESCADRQEPQSLLKELNPHARVGRVFGVVSGKGGVLLFSAYSLWEKDKNNRR